MYRIEGPGMTPLPPVEAARKVLDAIRLPAL